MYKPLCISLMIALSTTACGFHLKGLPAGSTQVVQNLHYPVIKLDIPSSYSALNTHLSTQLEGSGVKLNGENAVVLRVLDYQFRRQQLNGKLTEVLLHLNVTFRMEDQNGKALTQERTVRSYRNYQYNIETVNTENQQEQFLKNIMVEDIAQQISTQVVNNRLPALP